MAYQVNVSESSGAGSVGLSRINVSRLCLQHFMISCSRCRFCQTFLASCYYYHRCVYVVAGFG